MLFYFIGKGFPNLQAQLVEFAIISLAVQYFHKTGINHRSILEIEGFNFISFMSLPKNYFAELGIWSLSSVPRCMLTTSIELF